MCRELLEQEKRPEDGRCLRGSAQHASFLYFPFGVAASSGRWTTISISSVLFIIASAYLTIYFAHRAGTSLSLGIFCALRPKRANESRGFCSHQFQPHPCAHWFPLLCKESTPQIYRHILGAGPLD